MHASSAFFYPEKKSNAIARFFSLSWPAFEIRYTMYSVTKNNLDIERHSTCSNKGEGAAVQFGWTELCVTSAPRAWSKS